MARLAAGALPAAGAGFCLRAACEAAREKGLWREAEAARAAGSGGVRA